MKRMRSERNHLLSNLFHFFLLKTFFRFILNTIPRPLLIRLSYLFRPLLIWYFKGNAFTDPIDGKSFKRLLPYGYQKQRENVLSPSTLSLERHRLLWLYLKRETTFFTAPIQLLHFAPEQAFYKRFKTLKTLNYTTTDLKSPLADVKADICNLPFKSNTYDVILCNHVLEHIPDDTKAMRELFRVMKPGGYGIFQIPLDRNRKHTFEDSSITDKKKRSEIFGQYDHVRIYGLDYFDKLTSVGFSVNPIEYPLELTAEEVKTYALDKNEIIPFVVKPKL